MYMHLDSQAGCQEDIFTTGYLQNWANPFGIAQELTQDRKPYDWKMLDVPFQFLWHVESPLHWSNFSVKRKGCVFFPLLSILQYVFFLKAAIGLANCGKHSSLPPPPLHCFTAGEMK